MSLRQSVRRMSQVGRLLIFRAQYDFSLRGFASNKPPPSESLRRSALFTAEKKKQQEAVGRVKKIEVNVVSDFGNELLIMNEHLSTPYDCAKHISDHLCKQSLLALVDSNQPWDMHKPLTAPCQLHFIRSTDKDPWVANNTFWRSCSFMLGSVVTRAFRDDISVILHSFPSPNVYSGSFVLDAYIGLESWNPSTEELRALSKDMILLGEKELPFERLSVSQEVAQEMFSDNPYKFNHVSKIFENHNEVVVYRVGNHVDISRGPMMSHTGLLGRCTIASVHYLTDDQLFRFQGVALPRGHRLNHYAYGILEKRARYLNEHMIPSKLNFAFEPSPEYAAEVKEATS